MLRPSRGVPSHSLEIQWPDQGTETIAFSGFGLALRCYLLKNSPYLLLSCQTYLLAFSISILLLHNKLLWSSSNHPHSVLWLSHNFVGQKYGMAQSCFLLRSASAVCRTGCLFGGSGKKSTPTFIQVVDRTQFLVFVRLRLLFPCWLSAECCSLLLEATHILCHEVSPISKFTDCTGSLSCFEFLWVPVLQLARENFLLIKDSCDWLGSSG